MRDCLQHVRKIECLPSFPLLQQGHTASKKVCSGMARKGLSAYQVRAKSVSQNKEHPTEGRNPS